MEESIVLVNSLEDFKERIHVDASLCHLSFFMYCNTPSQGLHHQHVTLPNDFSWTCIYMDHIALKQFLLLLNPPNFCGCGFLVSTGWNGIYAAVIELSTVPFNFLLFVGNIDKQECVGWDFMSRCLWFCVYMLCSLMEKTLASKQDLHQEVSIMVSYGKHGRIQRGRQGVCPPPPPPPRK